MHFADASTRIDGEFVHLEDLVLHDAGAGIRTPTHERTIARDALRAQANCGGPEISVARVLTT